MTPEQILMQRIGALTFEVAQLQAQRDQLAQENAALRARLGEDEGDGSTSRGGGTCVFDMPTDRDFSTLDRKLSSKT